MGRERVYANSLPLPRTCLSISRLKAARRRAWSRVDSLAGRPP